MRWWSRLFTGFFGQNVAYPEFSTSNGLLASSILMVLLSAFLYVAFNARTGSDIPIHSPKPTSGVLLIPCGTDETKHLGALGCARR